MTITDGGEAGVEQGKSPVFDAEVDDPRLSPAPSSSEGSGFDWLGLIEEIVKWDATDALKVAALTVTFITKGNVDQVIDETELMRIMDRRRNTIKSFLRSLHREGWVRLDAEVNERERPTFVFRTIRKIG